MTDLGAINSRASALEHAKCTEQEEILTETAVTKGSFQEQYDNIAFAHSLRSGVAV